MEYAIETFELTKRYRRQISFKDLMRRTRPAEKTAVNSVNLKIREGEIFGLLGPNGSGKTTFLKTLCTILLPSSGTATIFGHDIIEEDHKVRQMVGLVTGEERSFYWRISGRENLNFFASLYGLGKKEIAREVGAVIELLDLHEVSDIRVSDYSTGMKQKLAIARGLLGQPRILFLDEPTRGLDLIAANNLLNIIRKRIIDNFGNTIILTTHIMREVEQLCDRIAILNNGQIVTCGSVDELKLAATTYNEYFIKVRNYKEEHLQTFVGIEGVISCSNSFHNNGVMHIKLQLVKESIALSAILKQMLQQNAEIVSCSMSEPSVEEMFRSLLKN